MIRLVLVIGILLGIGGMKPVTPTTSAYSDPVTADEALGAHPIVGSWRWDTIAANPDKPRAASIFRPNGTYEEIITGVGMVVGTWEATGARTAEVTAVFRSAPHTPMARVAGAAKIHMTVEVSPSGESIQARVTAATNVLSRTPLGHGGKDMRGTRVVDEFETPFQRPRCDAIGGLRCY
jgi:hypothetical protein